MTVDDKIKVFDSDDKSLKLLGELLSNDTSRRIIKLLIDKESYTNEISKKLDIRVSLVIHHLKKLEELGVLEITHKQIVRKGNDHRYFRMVSGLFLAPSKSKEEIDKSGFLKKIFREGIKFTSLGFVSVIAFFFSGGFNKSELHSILDGEIPDLVDISPLIYPLLIIIVGLSIFYFMKNKSKR